MGSGLWINFIWSFLMVHNSVSSFQKLSFPKGFEPTKNQEDSEFTRGWFISPFSLITSDYWWLALVAVVPALLVFFLIFIEIQITGLVISSTIPDGAS